MDYPKSLMRMTLSMMILDSSLKVPHGLVQFVWFATTQISPGVKYVALHSLKELHSIIRTRSQEID